MIGLRQNKDASGTWVTMKYLYPLGYTILHFSTCDLLPVRRLRILALDRGMFADNLLT